jgi:hypothetical protein
MRIACWAAGWICQTPPSWPTSTTTRRRIINRRAQNKFEILYIINSSFCLYVVSLCAVAPSAIICGVFFFFDTAFSFT